MSSETPTESYDQQTILPTNTENMLARIDAMKTEKPPKKVASCDNAGKSEIDYIFDFPTAVEALCRVMELGAVKYERDNWKRGGKPDREYISAAGRHVLAFRQGETFAEDTGCLHLAHAMWNIMALIELNYPGVTHDPEIFAEMKEHWAEVKRQKTLATQSRTPSDGWIPPPGLAEYTAKRADERAEIAKVLREGR